jgi:hypothetical protein
MTSRTAQTSPQVYARSAGVLYLIITVAAIIAHFYVPSQLIVPGNAEITASNIMASESLFRIGGIGSELVTLLSEIVLSVLIYVLFKPVSKTLSLVAVVSRLAMTTIHGINLLNLFFVWLLLSGADYLTVFKAEQLHALATLFLEAHRYGFAIGIAFFALHVFVLGYLILKSSYFPRILGVLFLIAAFAYLIDSSATLLFANSNYKTPGLLAMVIAIAEISFPLWLLIKGVRIEQWEKRTLASA